MSFLITAPSHNNLIFLVLIRNNSSFVLFCITVFPELLRKSSFFPGLVTVFGHTRACFLMLMFQNHCVYFSTLAFISRSVGESNWAFGLRKSGEITAFTKFSVANVVLFVSIWVPKQCLSCKNSKRQARAVSSAWLWSSNQLTKGLPNIKAQGTVCEQQERSTVIPSSFNSSWRDYKEKALPLSSLGNGRDLCNLAELPYHTNNPIPAEWGDHGCAHHSLYSTGNMEQKCWNGH